MKLNKKWLWLILDLSLPVKAKSLYIYSINNEDFMAKRKKKEKRYYNYECSLTGEKFRRTTKLENKDELVSIAAYYEMNPEMDDRPLAVKKDLGLLEEK